MKKLITATAFILFGTMLTMAQTTKKSDKKVRMAEKPASSTEMKMDTSVQPNGMNRTVDTATINNKSKMLENPKQIATKSDVAKQWNFAKSQHNFTE